MKAKVIVWGLVGILCIGLILKGLSIDKDYYLEQKFIRQESQLQIDTINLFLQQIESNLEIMDSSIDALFEHSLCSDSIAQVYYMITDKQLKKIIQMVDTKK